MIVVWFMAWYSISNCMIYDELQHMLVYGVRYRLWSGMYYVMKCTMVQNATVIVYV
jgi:hypothetical protein